MPTKLLATAEIVRLKGGVLSHLETREWEFQRPEEGIAVQTHPGVRYAIGVKEEWIDWDNPQRLGFKEMIVC